MKRKQFKITEETANKIISAAYKDANWFNRFIVWKWCREHEEVKKMFDRYRATASGIKEIKKEECPEDLLNSIFDQQKKSYGFFSDFYAVVFARPAVSLAVFAVIVSAIVFGVVRNKPVEYEFTESEIIEADKQAQLAFAIVGSIFKQTKTTLENDVLGNKVAAPLNKGLGIINNLFEGENNEIN